MFWELTPAETALHFEATAERARRAHNDRAWLAYYTAGLPNMKPARRLEDLQIKVRQRKAEAPEERLRVAQQWAARFR